MKQILARASYPYHILGCCLCLVLIIMLINIMPSHSHSSSPKDSSDLQNILSDFVFVGAGAYDRSTVPSHSEEKQVIPSDWEGIEQALPLW
jgi:hypothetical protein